MCVFVLGLFFLIKNRLRDPNGFNQSKAKKKILAHIYCDIHVIGLIVNNML